MMKVLSRVSVILQSCQKQYLGTFGGCGLGHSLSFYFSKVKKSKPELKSPSIHLSKLNE